MTATTLVTCAPPNPNGDLHLGHLSGPFLGADVLRRYLAAAGRPVVYVSYTDDESCYVPRRGDEIGRTPRETSFLFTRRIEETLNLAGMLPDYYGHPHRDQTHQRVVHEHFRRLLESGALVEREMTVPYCDGCDSYLYEAYLRGHCRQCGMPSDGTYCEDCGYPQDPDGVEAPVCLRCQTEPRPRRVRRLVLPLQDYAGPLADYYADRPWRPTLLDYCTGLLKEGLPDYPVSRRTGYGIPVPFAGWDGHILDTWSSGIFGYMAATAGYTAALGQPDGWRELWSDPDTEIVHFIGFDCSFSHAVLWPAMLLALGDRTLPAHVIPNEFYNLENDKFSTSRGHAIWGSEFLREHPADALRLHLCLTNPESEQTNFSRPAFDHTASAVLGGTFEGWATSLFELLAADAGPAVPVGAADAVPADLAGLRDRLTTGVGTALEPATFSLRRAAATLVEVAGEAEGRLRVARAGGAAGASGAAGRELAGHAALLATFAQAAGPILPAWSRHVWAQLGQPAPAAGADVLPWPGRRTAPVAVGQPAERYRRLFPATR